jgi:hypothetical protein
MGSTVSNNNGTLPLTPTERQITVHEIYNIIDPNEIPVLYPLVGQTDPEQIQNIDIIYEPKCPIDSEELCSICLNNKCYIKTQCQHVYCSCIFKHIIRKNNYQFDCPLCRTKIDKLVLNDATLFQFGSDMLEIISENR